MEPSAISYHDRECNLELLHSEEHTEHYEEGQLYDSEDMDTVVWYSPEVLAVWATLARDEEELDALYELDPVEREHAHVEQQPVENRKREEIEGSVRHH